MCLIVLDWAGACSFDVVVVDSFGHPIFGLPSDQEHMLAGRVVFGKELAVAVIDCAKSLVFAWRHDDQVSLGCRGSERIYGILSKRELAHATCLLARMAMCVRTLVAFTGQTLIPRSVRSWFL